MVLILYLLINRNIHESPSPLSRAIDAISACWSYSIVENELTYEMVPIIHLLETIISNEPLPVLSDITTCKLKPERRILFFRRWHILLISVKWLSKIVQRPFKRIKRHATLYFMKILNPLPFSGVPISS